MLSGKAQQPATTAPAGAWFLPPFEALGSPLSYLAAPDMRAQLHHQRQAARRTAAATVADGPAARPLAVAAVGAAASQQPAMLLGAAPPAAFSSYQAATISAARPASRGSVRVQYKSGAAGGGMPAHDAGATPPSMAAADGEGPSLSGSSSTAGAHMPLTHHKEQEQQQRHPGAEATPQATEVPQPPLEPSAVEQAGPGHAALLQEAPRINLHGLWSKDMEVRRSVWGPGVAAPLGYMLGYMLGSCIPDAPAMSYGYQVGPTSLIHCPRLPQCHLLPPLRPLLPPCNPVPVSAL